MRVSSLLRAREAHTDLPRSLVAVVADELQRAFRSIHREQRNRDWARGGRKYAVVLRKSRFRKKMLQALHPQRN